MAETDHAMANGLEEPPHLPEHAEHTEQPSPGGTPDPTATSARRTSSSTPRERNSLTLDQRRALRRWANSQQPRPSHRACIEWFQRTYGQMISQSTVSHSLSPKYSRLDGDNPQLSGSRLRFGNWPDVEKLVLLWYQRGLASGRHPTNEELADKAKNIFTALPRYKDENPPEFSPGWIHRFKKRYGLLIRRQRRHTDVENPAEDIDYLAECVPRFMPVAPDTSPTAIREQIIRVIGVEPSLNTCALVRDEVIRRQSAPASYVSTAAMVANQAISAAGQPPHPEVSPTDQHHPPIDAQLYATANPEDDPEVVLQNALRQLQQEEAEAEASAATVRAERDRADQMGQGYATPTRQSAPRVTAAEEELTLTPIDSGAPMSNRDRPVRCPFCVNQRMLRTIKEAVEHLSTHVVV
ncbi:uncharacterized protein DNG_02727 [Cephalotrichum gorgonifer]|uniref:HTH CENPB-type domain-containing protein n=1 Tax=Cephalotrichum gorgonifer TaxID=2041049 RepID=A0AAE8MVK4_9PEZI|nr:uncharacterized protein DNG_02727 [Cephalotrichum gorgonifer]